MDLCQVNPSMFSLFVSDFRFGAHMDYGWTHMDNDVDCFPFQIEMTALCPDIFDT